MAHPNVDLLRRTDDAVAKGDFETYFAGYTDDVVFHMGGDNKLTGDYRGLEQVKQLLVRFMEAGGELAIDTHAYLADDDHGAALVRLNLKRDGKTFATNEAFVYHFRDGKISEVWYQPFDQAGVDAWMGK
ncbi:MAG: nuclear transport factor 2 family protein [Candidatus Dormiibacterota bacterium]